MKHTAFLQLAGDLMAAMVVNVSLEHAHLPVLLVLALVSMRRKQKGSKRQPGLLDGRTDGQRDRLCSVGSVVVVFVLVWKTRKELRVWVSVLGGWIGKEAWKAELLEEFILLLEQRL